ncbi:AgmX/PglI C-terminal domain-containing protein [Chitinispirillales bacterium ANBcel5]|uniref:AgmX/PglI C-terminal domain-containing protein n=1 Tax=Cellulosispirillum alkaliphilum TaxID=3039283 RepID=UPI002A4F24AE|nr:AgmX/PglI C-terminal domain-containing protein [Chitinispirillales bacterium ANBcel5]
MGKIIVSGSTGCNINKTVLKQVKGSFYRPQNKAFLALILASVILHFLILYYSNKNLVHYVEDVEIDTVPERFARLIIEKPIPQDQSVKEFIKKSKVTHSDIETEIESKMAKTNVEKKATETITKVEERVRNVGLLGMLTGTGKSANETSVPDVLGAIDRKNRSNDLEEALKNIQGLRRVQKGDALEQKLVRRGVEASMQRENIDDLIAEIGSANVTTLSRKGDLFIERPEAIEGAGLTNVKRGQSAINSVVASHRSTIRLVYQRYLRRDPNLSGKITVKFTIKASGRVVDVVVIENSTGSESFKEEVIRRIQLWQFEKIPEGDVTVTYPFIFSAGG